jgi:hypothetical protein
MLSTGTMPGPNTAGPGEEQSQQGWGVQYSVSASVFLAIIILVRLARRTEARSKADERLTAISCVVFGVLIAGTPWGTAILHLVGAATQVTH